MEASKPRCALISTWKIDCGIAAFADKMVQGLEAKFDVDVFPLDQSILKANEPNVRRLGDKLIKDIANKIGDYDLVNIQFEPGIYGNRPKDICKRISMIISKSRNCYITFHTIRQGVNFSILGFMKLAVTKPTKAIDYWYSAKLDRCYKNLYSRINNVWSKKVFCHYHTKSAQRYVNVRYPNIKTIDFPLTFISLEDKEKYKASVASDKSWLLNKLNFPSGTVLVSTFGFISKYKGLDTVIRAIYELPNNYKLCIFGSVHPNSIQLHKSTDKYLKSLIDLISRKELNIPDPEEDNDKNKGKDPEMNDSFSSHLDAFVNVTSDKVVFGGNLNDEEFERAINASDVNVMSYLEVGQTSSGPMSISLDLSKKTIATYNKCFLQHKKYAENCFDQFDIGNFMQLKNLIQLDEYNELHEEGLDKYTQTYTLENRVQKIYETFVEMSAFEA